MTKLSVIIPTYREGGFDPLFGSLKNQTLKDYEVVVVDELFEWRKQAVAKYAEKLDIPLVHLPPKKPMEQRPFGCCNALNTGFIVADGDYVLPSQDFMWFTPDCFERHMKLQKPSGRVTVGLMHHYTAYPLGNLRGKITVFNRLHEETPPPERLELEDKRFLFNTVEEPDGLRRFIFHLYTSSRSLLPNAVFPYHYAIQLNGFDERLDIGHGYQDDNYVFRGDLLGFEFILDPSNISIHLTHPWSRKTPAPNQMDTHYQIIHSVLSNLAGVKAPNNFDLLQERIRWKHQQWVNNEGGVEKPVHKETYEKDYERARLDWLKEECKDSASILEVGCGDGYVLRYVLGDRFAGSTAAGLDKNVETIAVNKATFPQIKWLCWDVTAQVPLPCHDGEYDIVLLPAVLEHLPWDRVAPLIMDAVRVAKHKVLITIPNATYPTYLKDAVESVGKHQWALTRDRLYSLSLVFLTQYWPKPVSINVNYGSDESSVYFKVEKVKTG